MDDPSKVNAIEVFPNSTGKVFVCVGPNKGDSHMGVLIMGHDKFYFFEPMPDAAEWLRENNKDNSEWFHVIQAACGDKLGRATMKCYNKGLSSSLGTCTKQAVDHFAHVDFGLEGEIEVEVVNLGKWLGERNIWDIETLMIDAQGMDLTIMKTINVHLSQGLIKTLIHEIDHDDFRHYDGTPDNTLSSAIKYMESFGCYRMDPLPDPIPMNFDVTWRLVTKTT